MNNTIPEMSSSITIIMALNVFFMLICIERAKELINAKDDSLFIDHLRFLFAEILYSVLAYVIDTNSCLVWFNSVRDHVIFQSEGSSVSYHTRIHD